MYVSVRNNRNGFIRHAHSVHNQRKAFGADIPYAICDPAKNPYGRCFFPLRRKARIDTQTVKIGPDSQDILGNYPIHPSCRSRNPPLRSKAFFCRSRRPEIHITNRIRFHAGLRITGIVESDHLQRFPCRISSSDTAIGHGLEHDAVIINRTVFVNAL